MSARDQMSAGTPEQAEAGVKAWMVWAEKAGPAIVDLGTPLDAVTDAGTPVPAEGHLIGGYSVLQAESPTELSKVLEGHPHLAMGGTVEVLEMLAIPGM